MTGGESQDPQAVGLTARLAAVLTPAVALRLADASSDGLALADGDGGLVLVNQRMEEMFGYDRDELLGSPLDHLITAEPQTGHSGQQAEFSSQPGTGLLETRVRQAGLRKDATTFPAEISLSLVASEVGELTVAVFRDVTQARPQEDPASVKGAADCEPMAAEFPGSVVSKLFEVGLALQAAAELPAHLVRQRVLDAAARLDETIAEIREFVFRTRGNRPA
jgi:PAS domain S-box-containing protein